MSWIRTKLRDGKPTTDAEKAELEAYDQEAHGNVASDAPPDDVAPDVAPDAAPDAAPDVAPEPEQPVRSSRPPPPPAEKIDLLGGMPSIPKIDMADRDVGSPGKRITKWQDKYAGEGLSETSGREATCVYIASLHHGILTQLSDAIRESGGDPIVNVDKMRGLTVLFWDEALPENFVLTPTMLTVSGTGALLAQRLLRAGDLKRARDEKALADKRDVRPLGASPPPPPPPPPPARAEPGPPPPPPERQAAPAPPAPAPPPPSGGRAFDKDGPV
jgi:hypothetical protein